jgi:ABC-2 type transport system ATP-binding protein
MRNCIEVESLRKVYRVSQREAGMAAAVKNLFKPAYNEVTAVDGISFTLKAGEMVGFIGPNGAGKTTTLKMLSGLLHPTSGRIQAAGFTPGDRKPEYLKKIGFLMGNKSQLTWDNTIADSFYILKEIYEVSNRDYKTRMDELIDLLELGDYLKKLPRTLSLGERARCELASVLLHQPEILYLDEPTLGLDVSMQLRLRDFIRDYNRRHGTTVILTSHYMSDIVSLCPRVILIHEGKLEYDGELSALANLVAPFRLLKFSIPEGGSFEDADLQENPKFQAELVESAERFRMLRVRRENILPLTAYLMEKSITDLIIENPPLDAVIDEVYRNGVGGVQDPPATGGMRWDETNGVRKEA